MPKLLLFILKEKNKTPKIPVLYLCIPAGEFVSSLLISIKL